ncbi:hypothetical protein GA0115252_110326 [Streptomyces sp. DfronAA-171]|nr:hypothetical protein GA0115252_110326 [Streptomyces sp. DfronAA-171]
MAAATVRLRFFCIASKSSARSKNRGPPSLPGRLSALLSFSQNSSVPFAPSSPTTFSAKGYSS